MKKLILFFSFLFPVASSWAQPLQSSLIGSVIVDERSHTQHPGILKIEDFRYLPKTAFNSENNAFIDAARTNAGLAMLSSAIIPGSGQALNGNWGRAAVYFLVDVAGILYHVNRNNTARKNERAYERYANESWSVLAYGQWLVAYSRANNIQNGYDNLGGLQDQVFGKEPTWGNTPNDWNEIVLKDIRAVEVQTPFYFPNGPGSNFSHVVQDYGSQQYYELMSKYYQFVPGWRDFYEDNSGFYSNPEANVNQFAYPWDSSMGTDMFDRGTFLAAEFNDNYRQAGNILKIMLLNHVVSAFDAYFTVTLRNSRIETQANLMRRESLSVTWHF
ncbi:MAG: hypothetical protein ACMZ7B_09345 [Balneola sp.]